MSKKIKGCNLRRLKKRVREDKFFESRHKLVERANRGITKAMIVEAIGYDNPRICEDYPKDFPWPSCLILGWLNDGTPLHVQLAYFTGQTKVVTAYVNPDLEIWYDDLCTRR